MNTMRILSLHNDEDSGVALIENGKILDAVSEERFNRKKLYKGKPLQSLDYILSRHGLTLADMNYVIYGWHGRRNNYTEYAQRLARRLVSAMERNPASGQILLERLDTEFGRDAETRDEFDRWMSELGVGGGQLMYLDHHTSHAWGAFACSPFEEAFVFTFDGRGDLKSTTVSLADSASGVHEQDYQLSFDSLGFLYGQITHYLGFMPHRHEGKVTGLAAFGDPKKTLPLFRKLMVFEEGMIKALIGPYKPFYTNLHPDLITELDRYSKEDIAAGVQQHCEELVTAYIRYWMRKVDRPDLRKLCLAGGVAANVKINQRIAELSEVDALYVFPHMGDGGLPLGSACYANFLLTGAGKVEMDGAYLGPSFGDAQIEAALAAAGGRVQAQRMEDKIASSVEDLAHGQVVGWFDGRMEYGPRALGARSIMFHARDRSANDWLNKRMRRTEFMPFAPVTPEEYAADCYVGWSREDRCPHFMTKTFDCTPQFMQAHPAVVHVDGTARPQVVTEARNGDYYRVLKAYCERTGERALINTSFNAHEEPIVCTPADAIQSLLEDVIDVLVIGSFRVTAVR